MTKQLIRFKTTSRLKCDEPACGYVSNEPVEISPELIGKPCPICGASLLTQKDYDDSVAFLGLVQSGVDAINAFGRVLGLGAEEDKEFNAGVDVRTNIHNGNMTTTVKAADRQ